jgi:t-SNARE complex subunit (syntaxin)
LLTRKNHNPNFKEPKEKQDSKNFFEEESGTQAQIMKEQDKEIQAVASTVVNLKEIATVLGNELDEQSRLIDHIELKVDNTTNNLDSGLKRMKEFINANADTKQQVCIVGLIILLVVLLIVLFTL